MITVKSSSSFHFHFGNGGWWRADFEGQHVPELVSKLIEIWFALITVILRFISKIPAAGLRWAAITIFKRVCVCVCVCVWLATDKYFRCVSWTSSLLSFDGWHSGEHLKLNATPDVIQEEEEEEVVWEEEEQDEFGELKCPKTPTGRVWPVPPPPSLSLSLLPPFLLLLLLLLLFPSFPRSLHQHHSQWLNAGSLNKTKWEKEAEERKIERKRERERERERELTNQEEKAKRRRIIRRGKMRNQKKK